jgi:hypothetical protein
MGTSAAFLDDFLDDSGIYVLHALGQEMVSQLVIQKQSGMVGGGCAVIAWPCAIGRTGSSS